MGKDNDSNVQTSTSAPWGPYAQKIPGLLNQAFASGAFPDVYKGDTFADPNRVQRDAWNTIGRTARRTNPMMGGLLSNFKQTMNGNGLSRQQNNSLDPLRGYARGDMAGLNNPAFRQVVDDSVQGAVDQTNAMFSGGGRYAGGAHQGTVMEEAGDIRARALAGQMNQDQATQLQAQGMLQGVYGQGAQNKLAWGAMAPGINELRYADAAKLGQVGDIRQAQEQARLDSKRGRFDAAEGREMERINWLNSILTGTPYQTQTQTQPKGSMASGILGGGLAGYGVAGPWGALGGGLLGAFM